MSAAPHSRDHAAISPGLAEFRVLARGTRVIPVTRRLIADGETPVGLYRKLALDADGSARPGTFLLESAQGGAWARYSFIGASAVATLSEREGQTHWLGTPPAGLPVDGDPLATAESVLRQLASPLGGLHGDLPPLACGLVGYIGWDAVRRWEKLGPGADDELGVPELALMIPGDLAIYDHYTAEVVLVANAINMDGSAERVDAAHADAAARLDRMTRALLAPAPATVVAGDFSAVPEVQHYSERADYTEAIHAAKRAIVDGEAFQVVLAQRFTTACEAAPLEVYRALRRTNPSPYMYLLNLQGTEETGFAVIGSSPEALVTVKENEVYTHPIAGSRPRGAHPEDDALLAKELLDDPKERAEHLMLVDLARNDLAKVSVPGTVDVVEFMEIERFSHIMHLSSTVTGRLARGVTGIDVLKATFPAGTLSGAPKPRALQLIDELEPVGRGIYGGVVGYLSFSGDLDLAIAIRTGVLKDGRMTVQAGGGIVADSVPELEIQESENKAAAVLRAARAAATLRPPEPS
ncbi:anthranilate synthase component I [Sediminivirga luteola]|uniref:Anthranilate synthase component 1 n=1 Tax=Sediminivirga luteola TaxID=1774748 RepID=A0A8J2TYW1_9MICO|nr:anthranilate synthase component I [Sediminivirga luteola]MCI2264133.1 anthranilate synthase component I [Sediminivirga luteola]GGA17898.1 anthranilate synthase component I [Sediminivirga luteola]